MPEPAHDLRRGDRVVLLVPGSVGYVDLVIDLVAAGIVAVPLDPRLTEDERAGILADLDPTLVVDTVARADASSPPAEARSGPDARAPWAGPDRAGRC